MHQFIFESRSESDTGRLGAALAGVLPDHSVVDLNGTLGAGKTRLVQALAEACGIPRDEVVSPTFVLVQQHFGERTIAHIDAYRLRDDDEFLELGPEEIFETADITLIEWADRIAACLPPGRLMIDVEVTGETSRRFVIRGDDANADTLNAIEERIKNNFE